MFVPHWNGTLAAIDPGTGSIVWTSGTQGPVKSSPVYQDGRVYIGSDDDHVYAFDARNGDRLWRTPLQGNVTAAPVLTHDLLLIGSEGGHLFALDQTTGAIAWEQPAIGAIASGATVAGDLAYVGTLDGRIHAIDVQTGLIVWSYTSLIDDPGAIVFGGDAVYSTPAVVDGTVYVQTFQSWVYALDAATGAKQWSWQTEGSAYPASPTVTEGTVFIGSIDDDNLTALDADTGEVLWQAGMGSFMWGSATVGGGVAYVSPASPDLLAIDTATGAIIDTHETDGSVFEIPILIGGTLVAVTDGVVHGFQVSGTGDQVPGGDPTETPDRTPAVHTLGVLLILAVAAWSARHRDRSSR